MLTTAAQQQLINGRMQKNNGSRIKSDANNHEAANDEKANKKELDKVIEMLGELEKRLKTQLDNGDINEKK